MQTTHANTAAWAPSSYPEAAGREMVNLPANSEPDRSPVRSV